jgi:hypothetical protein
MRSVLLPALTLLPGLILAAEDEPAIGHWGNYLMVTAPADTADGRAVLALKQRVTVDFVDLPLSEVAAFLRQVSSVNIALDPSLQAANSTVTFKAKDMELGTVLKWITQLTRTHMGFVDKVVVLSQEPLKGATKTTLYDVSDLVMPVQDFPGRELAYNAGASGAGGILWGPSTNEPHPTTTVEELEDLLRKTAAARSDH